MMIESDNFKLRAWKNKDAERLAFIANNRNIADSLRDGFPHPYSIDDAKQFISNAMQEDSDSNLFAIDMNGVIVGSIGAFFKKDVNSKNAELGYFLAEEYWGKSIMVEAIRCITGYLFENYDIIRVYAEPFSRNTNSRKVLEKAGFRHEATLKNNIVKNGVVQDGCVYAILKDEFEMKVRVLNL